MSQVLGSLLLNKVLVYEVPSDPSAGAGTQAPLGTLALTRTGQAWLKTGPADTDWDQVDTAVAGPDWSLSGNPLTGPNPNTPNEFMGSLNDYDVVFRRFNEEIFRIAGLNALQQVLSATSNPSFAQSLMFKTTSIGAAPATFTIPVPDLYNGLIVTRIIGRQTGGAAGAVGDAASWARSTTVSRTGAVLTKLFEENDGTYVVDAGMTLSSAAVGPDLVFTITPVANRNFSWGARAELELISV